MLRMPNELRNKVLASAMAERRSMNSQIIVLLERALPLGESEPTSDAASG